MSLWKLRAADSNDTAFLYSSWLKSYRNYPTMAGIPNTIFYDQFHKVITSILSRPTSIVIVAHDPADPTTIFGYIVAEVSGDTVAPTLILHWVYIKHSVRGFGMATDLVKEMTTIPASKIEFSSRNRGIKDPTWVYNPFSLYKGNL